MISFSYFTHHDNEFQLTFYGFLAQYVDLDYQEGGIGEYQYYDRKRGRWDSSACKEHGDGRCVKMDCHLPNTHFSLLGYFKEPNFGQWMEQLFKHEGVCVWTDEEYTFMQQDRVSWPRYCTASYSTDEDGNTLYFDVQPISGGRIDLGLYTDERCSVDYQGSIDVSDVISYFEANGGNDSSQQGAGDQSTATTLELSEEIDAWNDAFEIFTICQPCKAYNLGYIPSDQYSQDDRDHDDEDDENEGYFSCYDDAGYHNVNQCMKFRTKTDMQGATVRDIVLAAQQGTIQQVKLGDFIYYSKWLDMAERSYLILVLPILILAVGVWMFLRAYKKLKAENSSLNEPLMPADVVGT